MRDSLSISRIGRGDPVTLLHGWGMNASIFDALGEQLANRREVICVDLPGYGQSPWDASLDFQDQAALISEQLPGGTLIGWSMGGLYATEIARQNPHKYDRLMLMCSNPCFVRRNDWDCAVEASVFDTFAQSLQDGWASTVKHFLSLQMLGNIDARQQVRALMNQMSLVGEPDSNALDFGLKLLKSTDIRPVLSELEVPVKMIFGQRDALVPVAAAKEISKVNAKIQVESLADAAHAPFLSHTAKIASMI